MRGITFHLFLSVQESIEEKEEKPRRKSSFMFSFEDLMTDSTCALKDTRYLKLSSRRKTVTDDVTQRRIDDVARRNDVTHEFENGRIVPLGRSVSVLSRRGRCEQARRSQYGRYNSESGTYFLHLTTNKK